MNETRPACPECGGRVNYDLTCHTYGSPETGFYACMPCDSAVEYMCVERYRDDNPGTCDWRYTHGLNPRNPRAVANETKRPAWIPEGQDCMETVHAKSPKNWPITVPWRVPGIPLIGDDDDE